MEHPKNITDNLHENILKYEDKKRLEEEEDEDEEEEEEEEEKSEGVDSPSSGGLESNNEVVADTIQAHTEQEVAKSMIMKQEQLNSSSSTPITISPTNQEYNKQRNFLVAQLVGSNDGNMRENPCQQRASAYQFPILADQDSDHDSLLAKLMQEHDQRSEAQSTGARLENNEAIGSNQPADPRQKGPGQKSHSNNDEHKNRSVDLDEHVKLVDLFGVQIVALTINGKERLCLAQISNTLLKDFSYNEIHNRRVALGITCVQCTPIQLEMLRRAGAMPSSSRRCGMITMREAERLCRSFLAEEQPPELPENFYFTVAHRVNYGCKGRFVPARYISSRAKCIECFYCGEFYSPNKFIFHSHKQPDATDCNPPDSPNINSWRKHINLDWAHEHSQDIKYAWEDVKSLFNGGTRRRTSLGGLGLSGFPSDHLVTPTPPAANSEGTRKPTDETPKGSGRSSARASGRKHHQYHPTTIDDDANIDVVVCNARQTEQQRATMQPLSQNEKRKIPMGAWSKDRAHTGHHAASSGEHSQSVALFKRSASSHFNLPYDNIAQQQIKRLATQRNWQQQQQKSTAGSKSAMHMPLLTDQQSPLYQMNYPYHMGTANDNIHHQANRQTGMGHDQQLANLNLVGVKFEPITVRNSSGAGQNCLNPNDMLQQNKSPINLNPSNVPSNLNNNGQDPNLHTPSSFIYGQLYSQLMQSQLAQQVGQRQQQIAPIEAQLALRQHIWSSLLANLRCNQSQPEQCQSNLHGAKSGSNQLPGGYCLPNALGQQQQQQQQTNSLLAAAAAAAASAATRNHPETTQQSATLEMNGLTNLPPSAPNNNLNTLNNLSPMRMYTTSAQGNANDMAAIFNGANDSCE